MYGSAVGYVSHQTVEILLCDGSALDELFEIRHRTVIPFPHVVVGTDVRACADGRHGEEREEKGCEVVPGEELCHCALIPDAVTGQPSCGCVEKRPHHFLEHFVEHAVELAVVEELADAPAVGGECLSDSH